MTDPYYKKYLKYKNKYFDLKNKSKSKMKGGVDGYGIIAIILSILAMGGIGAGIYTYKDEIGDYLNNKNDVAINEIDTNNLEEIRNTNMLQNQAEAIATAEASEAGVVEPEAEVVEPEAGEAPEAGAQTEEAGTTAQTEEAGTAAQTGEAGVKTEEAGVKTEEAGDAPEGAQTGEAGVKTEEAGDAPEGAQTGEAGVKTEEAGEAPEGAQTGEAGDDLIPLDSPPESVVDNPSKHGLFPPPDETKKD